MNRHCLLPLLVGLLATTAMSADDKKNLEPFQGKWSIVAVEVNGQKVDPAQFEKAVLTVTADERVLKEDDKVVTRSKFKVDPAKSPKTIDIMVSEGPLKDKTLK